MAQSLQEQLDQVNAEIAAAAGRFSFVIYERKPINGDKNTFPHAPKFVAATLIGDGGKKWCVAVTDRTKLPSYTNVMK